MVLKNGNCFMRGVGKVCSGSLLKELLSYQYYYKKQCCDGKTVSRPFKNLC